MKKKIFDLTDLEVIGYANPEDEKYVVKGAIVWLRSGSPPLKVKSVKNGIAVVQGKHSVSKVKAVCLTPEPTPLKFK
jgi:hypothetical protein